MPLIVNGERIDITLIHEEVERMRPHYLSTFKEQAPEDQEKQLWEWAHENVIERILMQQAAKNDPTKIPTEEVEKNLKDRIKESGENEEAFYKSLGLTIKDKNTLTEDIKLQLRVERLIKRLVKKISKPDEKQAKIFYESNKDKFIIPEQVRAAHIVKHVDASNSKEAAKNAIFKIEKANY